jgi:Protein of unknown function (DUF2934)
VSVAQHKQVSARARILWEQAGCPTDRDQEFWFDAENEFYETQGHVYRRDGTKNIKEALGFIKDWVTSLIQLQTAAIGAIGGFIGLKDSSNYSLSKFEWPFLVITVLSFMVSIWMGVAILNALPGATQRIPANPAALGADVFSIANEKDHWTLHRYSKLIRWFFVCGMISLVFFIVIRIVSAGIT